MARIQQQSTLKGVQTLTAKSYDDINELRGDHRGIAPNPSTLEGHRALQPPPLDQALNYKTVLRIHQKTPYSVIEINVSI